MWSGCEGRDGVTPTHTRARGAPLRHAATIWFDSPCCCLDRPYFNRRGLHSPVTQGSTKGCFADETINRIRPCNWFLILWLSEKAKQLNWSQLHICTSATLFGPVYKVTSVSETTWSPAGDEKVIKNLQFVTRVWIYCHVPALGHWSDMETWRPVMWLKSVCLAPSEAAGS